MHVSKLLSISFTKCSNLPLLNHHISFYHISIFSSAISFLLNILTICLCTLCVIMKSDFSYRFFNTNIQLLTVISPGFAADYQRSLSVPISILVEDTDSYSDLIDLSCSLDFRRPQSTLRADEITGSPPSTSSFLP